jgi:hypothetical protein
MKKFCFVVSFFIWIVIKNYWYDIKSEKKVKIFWSWLFLEEVKIREGKGVLVTKVCFLSGKGT